MPSGKIIMGNEIAFSLWAFSAGIDFLLHGGKSIKGASSLPLYALVSPNAQWEMTWKAPVVRCRLMTKIIGLMFGKCFRILSRRLLCRLQVLLLFCYSSFLIFHLSKSSGSFTMEFSDSLTIFNGSSESLRDCLIPQWMIHLPGELVLFFTTH